jgi:carbonic anhydrase/acetyltransferase-like protein (isoleucine patch superfamily)
VGDLTAWIAAALAVLIGAAVIGAGVWLWRAAPRIDRIIRGWVE